MDRYRFWNRRCLLHGTCLQVSDSNSVLLTICGKPETKQPMH